MDEKKMEEMLEAARAARPDDRILPTHAKVELLGLKVEALLGAVEWQHRENGELRRKVDMMERNLVALRGWIQGLLDPTRN